jgi:hypothetical protein
MKAFPTSQSEQYPRIIAGGMELRDYFAAKAMQAIAHRHTHEGDVSRNAYKLADAMMKVREQK